MTSVPSPTVDLYQIRRHTARCSYHGYVIGYVVWREQLVNDDVRCARSSIG